MQKTKEELRRAWLEALRGPDYQQTQGGLRTGLAFCCLGVLCDLYDHDQWEPDKAFDGYYYLNHAGTLPSDVSKAVGLDSHGYLTESELIKMNDNGKTFPEIADYLEKIFSE